MTWQLQCTKCGALTSTPPNTRAGGRFAFICRECKTPNAVDLPASALSDDDLNAFAALYDQLTGQGVAWRVTFAPPGGGLTPCRVEVHWPPSPDFPNGQDVDAEAGSLRKLVTELGQALVKTAIERRRLRVTDVTFKRCDSCERCNSLDVEPDKRCGPVVRYFVQLSDGRTPFYVDICEACAAQRPIKALHQMAREALARMTGKPPPEHEPE